jgi:uncharacterized membrane protein HdeD (DUF308 family)
MGDPTWTDVLFGLCLLLFFARLWWVVRRDRGSSWQTHVLAILVGIIAALVVAFMPFKYLATLNALLGL